MEPKQIIGGFIAIVLLAVVVNGPLAQWREAMNNAPHQGTRIAQPYGIDPPTPQGTSEPQPDMATQEAAAFCTSLGGLVPSIVQVRDDGTPRRLALKAGLHGLNTGVAQNGLLRKMSRGFLKTMVNDTYEHPELDASQLYTRETGLCLRALATLLDATR